jgi:hypothetical protein
MSEENEVNLELTNRIANTSFVLELKDDYLSYVTRIYSHSKMAEAQRSSNCVGSEFASGVKNDVGQQATQCYMKGDSTG